MSAIKPPVKFAQGIRRRELAQIHIAVKELGISEDDHRALLLSVCKVKSAADLDWRGRKCYIEHLKKLGFKVKSKKPDIPMAKDPQSRKIRSLWLTLADEGIVRNRSEAALAAYVKRQTGVATLEVLTAEQAGNLIESLKQWLNRTVDTNHLPKKGTS